MKPLSAFPVVVTKRLWKITPFERGVPYSTHRPTKTSVAVLVQGRTEIYRRTIPRDVPGRIFVQGQWLVHETFPRSEEAERRARIEAAAIREARATRIAKLEATPAFRAYVQRVTAELGKPRRARACDRVHRAFRAPEDRRCAELVEAARGAGAAATLYLAPWGRELRIAESLGAIGALFDWQSYHSGTLEAALDALDEQVGATFEYIGGDDWFALRLDSAPPKSRAFYSLVTKLATALHARGDTVARELAATHAWIRGKPASTWKKSASRIYDPGTEDEDD